MMIVWLMAVAALCFVLERLRPGWRLPAVPTWWPRVVGVNVVQVAVVLVAGVTWERWLSQRSLLQLSQQLDPVGAGALAYVVATFVFYWWHRLRHESDFFWRGFHQIHHSPQRLEVITSFYKHRNNYGDLVIWDMLFGTYDNPPTFDATCGFDDAREQRLGAMLRFRDVHR